MLWSHAVQRRDRRADENEKDLGLGFLWIGPGGLIQKCGESNFDINVGTDISLSGLEAVCRLEAVLYLMYLGRYVAVA